MNKKLSRTGNQKMEERAGTRKMERRAGEEEEEHSSGILLVPMIDLIVVSSFLSSSSWENPSHFECPHRIGIDR